MNREIEFRGKEEDTGKWRYGDLVQDFSLGDSYYIGDNDCNEVGAVYYQRFAVIPESIGQYTGLKDKNGKKIFEGDIVHYEDFTGIKYEVTGTVVYTQNCMFEIEYYDKILKKNETRPLVCHEHPIFASKKIEVISNIYEDNLESEVN